MSSSTGVETTCCVCDTGHAHRAEEGTLHSPPSATSHLVTINVHHVVSNGPVCDQLP